ncbi:hypothetical protein HKBW3S09_00882 [Candidatus Hakubella thermalkaliphila]|uniref:YgiT-type zinc finger protein n=1 Tax=Candidatus Hakubella thermalkaliphila TaxID=2754717 RepID=A0A6V8NSX9_9ACTN|nr:hypothetical protein [Candidatus Hakubella thermalkaliphila]GFP23415.1 hypothetical protein HKBW3S09_00882 [Candidatus Hakubella thermalkaliphila]GFP30142.1 hypothetical protein HKBW3S34_01062 [Candidatus Hakubella thermalkaliphila]GFP40061.1 hypothetical protein HKBW3S47_01758 [Candidatus Hakubella thermalkaliphila]
MPAEVCRQCGEVLLRPDILERVQEVVWSEVAPKRTASVPVYDLAQVKVGDRGEVDRSCFPC